MNDIKSRGVWCVSLVLVVALLPGCGRGGSSVTKQNADKIQAGMAEADVVALLGPATDSAEIAVPNLGSLLGDKMPSGVELPKNSKQSFWRDGARVIAVTLVDGKVVASLFTDAASNTGSKEVPLPNGKEFSPPSIPGGLSDQPFAQSGNFTVISNQEGVVNFAIPYALPPNVEFSGVDQGNVLLMETKATGFKWKGVGDVHFGGSIQWTAKGVKATKLPEAETK